MTFLLAEEAKDLRHGVDGVISVDAVGFSELPLQHIVEYLTCKLFPGDYIELKSPNELKNI